MPRIVDISQLEDCLESTVVQKITVAPPLDEELMRCLAIGARLQFFAHFPRPYFRIERSGLYVIQGIIGNTTFRVTSLKEHWPETEDTLCRLAAEATLEGTHYDE